MLKKFIVTIALAVGTIGGGGLAYGLTHLHTTEVGGYGAVYKGFEKPKYSTSGSGWHQGMNREPHYYHNYWTGGKKYRQNAR